MKWNKFQDTEKMQRREWGGIDRMWRQGTELSFEECVSIKMVN